MARVTLIFAATQLWACVAAAADGLFIEGGVAAAFAAAVDGSISATNPDRLISTTQEFETGFAARGGLGYRQGRYALTLSGEFARNRVGDRFSVSSLAPQGSTVRQDGTYARWGAFLGLDYMVADITVPSAGVSFRPFLGAMIGVQRLDLDYEPNATGDELILDPLITPVARSGVGLAIALPRGWEAVLRYDVAVTPGAELSGYALSGLTGERFPTTYGFTQIEQFAGLSLRYALGALFGDDRIAERRRNRVIAAQGRP